MHENYIFQVRDTLFVCLGILSASFGIKGFLLPNHFIDGGVTGISMLLSRMTGISLSILLLVINLPFVIFAFRQISKAFGMKTSLAMAGLALVIFFVPFPVVTNDKLLAAIFGGFFLGAGVGLSIRGGCVLDGTDILALLISKNSPATVGEVIFVLNLVVFSFSAWVFGIEPAMYSTLTYLSASKTVDYLIHGIEEYTGMIIVSSKSEEIRNVILNELGRGVTIYKGKRGYTNTEQDILFCVITRLEIMKFQAVIRKIDSSAFIIMHSINDATGGLIKKRALYEEDF